uniref:Uncharacterized protein n=1 Tax=Oryza glumipatula TaxID=40148 RepID=A0A0E0ATZ3_9ORYZ
MVVKKQHLGIMRILL